MEFGFRVFFRLGVVLLLLFVAFRNFRGFPQEAEAIARGVGGRSLGHRSYNSMYRGRYIYRPSFGRSGRSRGYEEPIDKQRHYYETKMAEWRQKQRLLMANSTNINGTESQMNTALDFDYEDPSEEEEEEEESEEYDYDQATTTTTTTTPAPTTTTTATAANSSEIPLLIQAMLSNTNETSETEIITTATATMPTTTSKPMVQPIRRSYGLRYGRVKVETLKH